MAPSRRPCSATGLLLVAAAIGTTLVSSQFRRSYRVASEKVSNYCPLLWTELVHMRDQANAARQNALTNHPSVFEGPKLVYDPYEPTWACHIEQRVGREFGDGGKFVCGKDKFLSSRSCLAYSVGSNGDISFEESVIRKFGCEVHTFDPTGDTSLYQSKAEAVGAIFHPWGLSGKMDDLYNEATNGSNPLFPLSDIVSQLGHTGRKIDLLKVDCEGCEFDSFRSIWAAILQGSLRVGQVLVELHGTSSTHVNEFFQGAHRADFNVFHKERNHWGCDGYNCVEFSLISNETAWDIFSFTHCAPN